MATTNLTECIINRSESYQIWFLTPHSKLNNAYWANVILLYIEGFVGVLLGILVTRIVLQNSRADFAIKILILTLLNSVSNLFGAIIFTIHRPHNFNVTVFYIYG